MLYEIAILKLANSLGFNGLKSFWVTGMLSAIRLTWVILVLYHTVPIIQDEVTRVSRIFGLQPVYLISMPKQKDDF